MSGALHGLRVVEVGDATTAVAGRLLGELGADVVIVEPPSGSHERQRPPFLDDVVHRERSLRWWAHAGGKRSVVLDLTVDEGRDAFVSLVTQSDVVLEGTMPGLDDLGLGWDALADRLDSVVWVSVTPFGRDSARVGDPFTDLTLLAGGGPIWNCGYDDHAVPPIRGAGEQAFNVAGHYAAIGALVAVAHRDRTGEGQLVEVNINAACNVTSEQTTYNWLVAQLVCTRQTGRHAYHTPSAPVQVRCADGAYATTGVLPRLPDEFAGLARWIDELGAGDELPEMVFLRMAAERTSPVDIAAIGEDDEATAMLGAAREAIRLIASKLPAKAFFLESQRRGFPTGAVLSPEEAFDDEHTEARGFRIPVEHAELGRTVLHPGVPYRFSASPPQVGARAPSLGEHTVEVLAEVAGGDGS
jgi:crotonobetainyl-CoA:carnitine CoA-transferase CaiB-like acyl-CoA transferase